MREMIIDGEKLADYLKKYHVSKDELISSLQERNVSYEYIEDESRCDFLQSDVDEVIFASNLFKKGAHLNYEVSARLINLIGADDVIDIIDWEGMGIEKPRNNPSSSNGITLLFTAIRELGKRNAHQSYAI